jgi:GAF domain-containing protein
MIEGTIPKAVPNTAAIEELRELAFTKLSAIGAYVGVPMHTTDGKLYGTIVAVSHEPREDLGASQVRLLELISGIIGGAIEQQRMEKENERLRARMASMTEELDAAEEDRRLSRILLSGEFRTIPHGTPPPE